MNDNGEAALDAMIARLRAFGENAAKDAAKEAKPLVREAARKTAAEGEDPYGAEWIPRKDGSRAMPKAADAIQVRALGTVVQILVTGGYAIQGYLKEGRRRLVIPRGDRGDAMPDAVRDALLEGARHAFKKAMG